MPKTYPSWAVDADVRAAIDARAAELRVHPSALVEGLGRAMMAGDVAKLDEHVGAARDAVKKGQRTRGAERLQSNADLGGEERRADGVQRARAEGRYRKPKICSACGDQGHNRRTCHTSSKTL